VGVAGGGAGTEAARSCASVVLIVSDPLFT
jgi:hypothetical protein